MNFENHRFVTRLAEVISRFEGGNTNGEPLATAIVDSGIVWELEQEAFNRGYDTAVVVVGQVIEEDQGE